MSKKCVVPDCGSSRLKGSNYCEKHQPGNDDDNSNGGDAQTVSQPQQKYTVTIQTSNM